MNTPLILPESFRPYWDSEMDIDAYHGRKDFISSGGMRMIEQLSPEHFYHRICEGPPDRPTQAQEFGRIVHIALLEPDRFARNLILEPDHNKRSSIERAKIEQWRTLQGPEAIIIEKKDFDAIVAIRKRIESFPVVKGLLKLGRREWSGFGRCPLTGIGIRARPDFFHAPDETYPDGIIMDVKTTVSAREEDFKFTIENYLYHLSLYAYRKVAESIEGVIFPRACILAVEKSPPYAMNLFWMDDMIYEETAEFLYKQIMFKLKACIEGSDWPGYNREAVRISPSFGYENKMRVRMDFMESKEAMNG